MCHRFAAHFADGNSLRGQFQVTERDTEPACSLLRLLLPLSPSSLPAPDLPSPESRINPTGGRRNYRFLLFDTSPLLLLLP